MLTTGDPRRVGLQEAPEQSQIRTPPPPPALTVVIAGAAPPAQSATLLRALTRTHRDHHRLALILKLNAVDHRRLLDAEHACPYRGVAHAAPRSVVLDFDTQNLSRDGVLHVQPVRQHPRKRPESRKKPQVTVPVR